MFTDNNLTTTIGFSGLNNLCASYCMVCASVREDVPRALASGLSSLQTQNHTTTCILHQHVDCELFGVKQKVQVL